jgi:hypothetical protein
MSITPSRTLAHDTRGDGRRIRRARRFTWWALAGAFGLALSVWGLAPAPALHPVEPALLKLHVVEVTPTDETYREPARAFGGDIAYWRVAIHDARNSPVAAARVHVEVVDSNGAVHARRVMATGRDGLALFAHLFRPLDPAGIYTVRVVDVSHVNRRDVLYDRAADTARSNSFSLR